MVLRGRFFQVAIGLAISIPAAIAAGKLMTQKLFSVRPWDPVMLASATLALGLLASALPAWRAAGVEPMVALRNERGMDDLFWIKTVQISFSSSWSICQA
jgi:putative ABC transport system permease protein